MKKLSLLTLVLSFGLAAPVFACPSMDAEHAKTAKKTDKNQEKATAQKDAPAKAKPAESAKKTADKPA